MGESGRALEVAEHDGELAAFCFGCARGGRRRLLRGGLGLWLRWGRVRGRVKRTFSCS